VSGAQVGDNGLVRVALLGPFEVQDDAGDFLPVAGSRLRDLIARLALAGGRPVSTAALADAVWGDDPPADLANALQTLVSRARRALGGPAAVEQSAAGYRLAVTPDDSTRSDTPRLRPLSRESVPPESASVPAPSTAPTSDDPLPESVNVAAAPIAMVAPVFSVSAPETETPPLTPIEAPLRSDILEEKCAPASNVSAVPDSASVPPPVMVPAKLAAPVSVKVSFKAMLRAVPAPAEKVPA